MTTMSFLDKLVDNVLGRLVLTALSAVVVALAIPFLFYTNSVFLPTVLRWTALALLGCFTGIAARSLLSDYHIVIRLIYAWGVLLGCLWLVFQLTGGYVGFELVPYANPVIDWGRSGQILFSALITWLAVFAQRKPRVRVNPDKQTAEAQPLNLPKVRATKKNKSVKVDRKPSRINPPAPALPRLKPWQPPLKNLGKRFRLWQRQAGEAASHSRQKAGTLWKRSRQALRLPFKPSSRKVNLSSPRLKVPSKPSPAPLVHLVGTEEHRCPYCLELVEPDDPRGIIICPECHTYHHADCWAVTGACQVPHHHT